jgi:hypothetical protein
MSEAELDVAIAELEETRQTAERELDAVGVGGRRSSNWSATATPCTPLGPRPSPTTWTA